MFWKPCLTNQAISTSLIKVTSSADILQQLANEEEASQFLEMVVDTGLNETLSASGPFTVFVPVNQARPNQLQN